MLMEAKEKEVYQVNLMQHVPDESVPNAVVVEEQPSTEVDDAGENLLLVEWLNLLVPL